MKEFITRRNLELYRHLRGKKKEFGRCTKEENRKMHNVVGNTKSILVQIQNIKELKLKEKKKSSNKESKA